MMRRYSETIVVDEATGETVTIEADTLEELDKKVEALLGEE